MKECQRLLERARDSDCDQSRLEIAEEKDKNKQLMKLQSEGLTLLGVLVFFFLLMVDGEVSLSGWSGWRSITGNYIHYIRTHNMDPSGSWAKTHSPRSSWSWILALPSRLPHRHTNTDNVSRLTPRPHSLSGSWEPVVWLCTHTYMPNKETPAMKIVSRGV